MVRRSVGPGDESRGWRHPLRTGLGPPGGPSPAGGIDPVRVSGAHHPARDTDPHGRGVPAGDAALSQPVLRTDSGAGAVVRRLPGGVSARDSGRLAASTPPRPSRSSWSCFQGVLVFLAAANLMRDADSGPPGTGHSGGRLLGSGGASVPGTGPHQRRGVDRWRAGFGAGPECQQRRHDSGRRPGGADRPQLLRRRKSSIAGPRGLLATLLGAGDSGDRLARRARGAPRWRDGLCARCGQLAAAAPQRSHRAGGGLAAGDGGASPAGDEEPAARDASPPATWRDGSSSIRRSGPCSSRSRSWDGDRSPTPTSWRSASVSATAPAERRTTSCWSCSRPAAW